MSKQFVLGLACLLVTGCALGFLGTRIIAERRAATQQLAEGDHPLVELLALDASQERRIQDVDHAYAARVNPLEAQILQRREELYMLVSTGRPDKRAVDAKLQELGELQMQMDREAVEHLLAVRQVLDERQCRKLFDALEPCMCAGSGGGCGAHDEGSKSPGCGGMGAPSGNMTPAGLPAGSSAGK